MNQPAVTVIDVGIGNIRSVVRMFELADADARIARQPAALDDCRRLVLPGVGAFDAGMTKLRQGWLEPLNRLAFERAVPVLGICLGMQLLCRRSEEGTLPGLGWIQADVTKLDTGGRSDLKLPHMGWSVVTATKANPLIPLGDVEQRFYHTHKYRAVCDSEEDVFATAEYGTTFTTGVWHGNVYGVQFHPEKSHRFGRSLIQRFLTVPC